MFTKKFLLAILCVSLVLSFTSNAVNMGMSANSILGINSFDADAQNAFGFQIPGLQQLSTSSSSSGFAPEFATSIEDMTDTSKLYVLEGYIYKYAEVTIPVEPVNELDVYGYMAKTRLVLNGTTAIATNATTTNYIPVKKNDVVLVNGWQGIKGTTIFVCFYDANKNFLKAKGIGVRDTGYELSSTNKWIKVHIGLDGFEMNMTASSLQFTTASDIAALDKVAYVRISAGTFNGDEEIYVNKHLQTGTTTEYQWVNTGTTYAPNANAERIDAMEGKITEHTEALKHIQSVLDSLNATLPQTRDEALNLIKGWNKPIYDRSDVVLFEGNAVNISDKQTVDSIYAAYDALMARFPRHITKTLLGYDASGEYPIYRYDFEAPKAHEYADGYNPDTEKPTAILISGIHYEWASIWSLYYALEEILTNPEFRDVAGNTHLIVVPACNPYCLPAENYAETNGRKNANGVEIHRNFTVDHEVISTSSNNYGGAAPLSEVESQYIDLIMKTNPNAAFFLSCHNFTGGGKDYGTSFIWASTATSYLYNLSDRFALKMSYAWEDKYGDTFRKNIDANKTSSQPDGDYTVGLIGMSMTPGTEAKHAMLYGIHGTTLEVSSQMVALNTASNSAETINRGAEVYANYIKTAFENYDHTDKEEYAPVLGSNLAK